MITGALFIKLLNDVVRTCWKQEVDEEVRATLEQQQASGSGGEPPPTPGDASASETEESIRRSAANARFMALLAQCDQLAETKARPEASPVEIAALTIESSALARAAKAIVDGVRAVRPADYRVVG